MIPGMAQLAGSCKRAERDKVLQVSGRGRPGRFGNADVILRAEPALKSVDAFSENPGDHLILPRIQLSAQFLVESCLGDIEIDAPDRVALRLDDRLAEVDEPISDL